MIAWPSRCLLQRALRVGLLIDLAAAYVPPQYPTAQSAVWRVLATSEVSQGWEVESLRFFSTESCTEEIQAVPAMGPNEDMKVSPNGEALVMPSAGANAFRLAARVFDAKDPRVWNTVGPCSPATCSIGFSWESENRPGYPSGPYPYPPGQCHGQGTCTATYVQKGVHTVRCALLVQGTGEGHFATRLSLQWLDTRLNQYRTLVSNTTEQGGLLVLSPAGATYRNASLTQTELGLPIDPVSSVSLQSATITAAASGSMIDAFGAVDVSTSPDLRLTFSAPIQTGKLSHDIVPPDNSTLLSIFLRAGGPNASAPEMYHPGGTLTWGITLAGTDVNVEPCTGEGLAHTSTGEIISGPYARFVIIGTMLRLDFSLCHVYTTLRPFTKYWLTYRQGTLQEPGGLPLEALTEADGLSFTTTA